MSPLQQHGVQTLPYQYRIKVEGSLRLECEDWFDGLELSHDSDGNATLVGPLADQAALYGVLKRVRNLGLSLVSVQRLPE